VLYFIEKHTKRRSLWRWIADPCKSCYLPQVEQKTLAGETSGENEYCILSVGDFRTAFLRFKPGGIAKAKS